MTFLFNFLLIAAREMLEFDLHQNLIGDHNFDMGEERGYWIDLLIFFKDQFITASNSAYGGERVVSGSN